ncbi:MAG: 50S ribosomal protein L9, partial [Bacteroidaceae bacterium]|nr:50S ribosomal protein L9 [Bacteroidaceae bacterium]
VETVKAVGTYSAVINLHREVKAQVAFEVVAE